MKLECLTLYLLVLSFLFAQNVACTPDKEKLGSHASANNLDNQIEDQISDQSCDTDPAVIIKQEAYINTSNFLAIKATFETDIDVTAYIEYTTDNENFRKTPSESFPGGTIIEVDMIGLTPDTEYQLRPVVSSDGCIFTKGDTEIVTTGAWPEEWPKPTAKDFTYGEGWITQGWSEEEIICLPQKNDIINLFMCVNRHGTPVWYLTYQDTYYWLPVVRPLSNGTIAVNSNRDKISFYNKTGQLLNEYSTLWFQEKTVLVHQTFHHDIIEIKEGPWAGAVAFLTYAYDTVTFTPSIDPIDITDNMYLNFPYANITQEISDVIVTDAIIVFDYKTETVLWEWSFHGLLGDSQPMLQEMPYTRWGIDGPVRWNTGALDLTHTNTLLHGVDDAGQFFWLNVRNQDWIVKLRVESNNEASIEWRLGYRGDFTLVDDIDSESPRAVTDELWMYHGHTPAWMERRDNRYNFLIFDNGNFRPRPSTNPYPGEEYSRIASYIIDENTKQAMVDFDYGTDDRSDPDFFLSWNSGDAYKIPNGNILFTNGGSSSSNNFIAELDYSDTGNTILWKLESDPISRSSIYRSSYFPSIYNLTWTLDIE